MKSASTLHLARSAFDRHLEVHGDFNHYAGILTLHGMARLATKTADEELLALVKDHLAPYIRGERTFFANFPNYLCGGNATAWMLAHGHLPEAAIPVRKYAEEIMNDAPRNPDGILCRPHRSEEGMIWIDVAFAVTPFLLFAGLALKEERYIEEAFQQTAKMVQALRVESTGLVNQAINMRGPGHRSTDHWSRGNGWAALALTELAVSLPQDHPRKSEALALYRDHVEACARCQNEQGLWHQEMTEPRESYVETSGSGLMLYALGSGLEAGLLDESHRARFERGVTSFLAYINEDTDIFHACRGCLCPGQGTPIEYMAKPPILNDVHAFGPVVLAMGQAHLLGLTELDRANPNAHFSIIKA